jgi:hypothetical protein
MIAAQGLAGKSHTERERRRSNLIFQNGTEQAEYRSKWLISKDILIWGRFP